MSNFTKVLHKLTASLEANSEQALADEVRRVTMREMFTRLSEQREALLKLVDSSKEYHKAKYQVADIALRLKESGMFSKTQATQLCKQCDKVNTTIKLLDENTQTLKELIDHVRREVE